MYTFLPRPEDVLKYQFPMGKVKKNDKNNYVRNYVRGVSIPYGKGKADSDWAKEAASKIVSIPYGKGKEQHFVLHFKYTP